MKSPLTIILFLAFLSAIAQEKIDSLQAIANEVKLPELPDSLKTTWYKVDSIRTDFNNQADSLQNAYSASIASIDSEVNSIQYKIDSLNNLQLPAGKLTRKLDSLQNKKSSIETDFNSKVGSLKSKTIGKLDKIEMTPEMKESVGELTQKINGFDPSKGAFAKIPAMQVKGFSIPGLKEGGGLSSLSDKASSIAGLPNIDSPLANVGEIGKTVEGVSADVKNIAQGNVNDVKAIPEALENQAGKIDGVAELQKQSAVVDEYKNQLDGISNPDNMKQQAKDMARKQAVDHFAGKEEQLKAAMDKMSKYKQKYSSVKSIKDLPKRPPNAMKGKRFIERIVPGMFLQFQLKNYWLIDVNPYAGYRVSGRFTPGIGWNQRFAYDKKAKMWSPESRIFGPRAFLDVKLGRGFIAHLEQEVMNTYVPPKVKAIPFESGKREWVWSTMLGMKKQYTIYKNFKGTVLIQYNLFNPEYKAPYLDRLNSRMGFEYVLKARKKKETQK